MEPDATPTRAQILAAIEQANLMGINSLRNAASCRNNIPLLRRLNIEILELRKQVGQMDEATFRRACLTQLNLYSQLEPLPWKDLHHVRQIQAELDHLDQSIKEKKP